MSDGARFPRLKKVEFSTGPKGKHPVISSAHGLHSFYLVCQEISEMMPKDFLESPQHPSMKRFERLAR